MAVTTLIAAAALALTVAVPAAVAAPAPVTVSSIGTGYASLRLTRPLVWRGEELPKLPVRLSGAGARGFLLVSDDDRRSTWLLGVKDAGPAGWTVDGMVVDAAGSQVKQPGRVGVPAGRYRLYALGTGQIRVTIPGLSVAGSRRAFTATARTEFGTAAETAPTYGGFAPNHYQYVKPVALRSDGLMLTRYWFRGEVRADHEIQFCWYRGQPPAGLVLRGCPGGWGVPIANTSTEVDYERAATAITQVPAGGRTTGVSGTVVGTVRAAGAYVLWVGFDPA